MNAKYQTFNLFVAKLFDCVCTIHLLEFYQIYNLGLSRFTHVSIQLGHDPIDPIHYPFVQTNATKIYNSECHLNDLLNKIKLMNREHKYIIIHNTSASNCNVTILFVMVDKNQFVGIFWQHYH